MFAVSLSSGQNSIELNKCFPGHRLIGEGGNVTLAAEQALNFYTLSFYQAGFCPTCMRDIEMEAVEMMG